MDLAGQCLAVVFVDIEQCDPDALGGEQPGGGRSKSGGASGDDRGDVGVEVYQRVPFALQAFDDCDVRKAAAFAHRL